MEHRRLIRGTFLVAAFMWLFVAAAQERPSTTVYRSLLDDLTPEPSLKSLAASSVDFRGCDGGEGLVVDFWTFDMNSLYQPKAPEPDARVHERFGCRVNDFWSGDIAGLYTLTSAALSDPSDPAIKRIELSIEADQDPN